jgi:TonB family protein
VLTPRPDTRAAGRGGTREAREPAAHLSDSIDGLTLDTDPTLLTPESQISRLETEDERRSREDRRTTPSPMELTFVATGPGRRMERRPVASADPSRGSVGAVPLAAGSRPVPPESEDSLLSTQAPRLAVGAVETRAAGVPDGVRPAAHRRSAAIAVARPALRQGRASISTVTKGRPADTVDSSLAVASLVQSLITASSAGGPRGEGPGGAEGGGAPGAGGPSGLGVQSRASGEGGADDGAETSGVHGYAQSVTRKVYPYWEDAFPTWARVEGRGGVAVIGVTLDRDGRIRDLRVVRQSGFPEFDANVARALEQASPYGRLPRAVEATGLTLHIAFDAMNPAVGRHGPGPGRR